MSDSTSATQMSLEQFESRLLDGDRWIELIDGRFVQLNPPDDGHGDVVRNLARTLAAFLKKSNDLNACFELPLVLSSEPPTVRCPAVSCFRLQTGNRFAETDKVLTDSIPSLVIEVASTNDRRDAMSNRVRSYLDWGVEAVWVIDPVARRVYQFHAGQPEQMLKESQVLQGKSILSGFSMPVSDLFRQPEWMKQN
jgi:Uma2 family endonuclease